MRDSQADLSRITAELGYNPVIDFEKGLDQTLAWFLDSQRQDRDWGGER